MPRIRACGVSDLEDRQCMRLKNDLDVAVFRVDGEFYATSDACTHEEWSLSEDGYIEGHDVICALHLARFDVRTGEATGPPATKPLRTYSVVIINDEVWVEAAD